MGMAIPATIFLISLGDVKEFFVPYAHGFNFETIYPLFKNEEILGDLLL